jgi:hypothetical protein
MRFYYAISIKKNKKKIYATLKPERGLPGLLANGAELYLGINHKLVT